MKYWLILFINPLEVAGTRTRMCGSRSACVLSCQLYFKHIGQATTTSWQGSWYVFPRRRLLTLVQRSLQPTLRAGLHTNNTELIRKHTKLSRNHMTPEIALYLITPECPLWSDDGRKSPFTDPFWAFYWPGGQVLTRFIIDKPCYFKNKTVLDVGSGCGASAIACKLAGARDVIANDVDEVALDVIDLNAKENDVIVSTSSQNLIGTDTSQWSTILLGDMFYDEDFRNTLVDWLVEQHGRYKTDIFIGDPGRLPLSNHPIKERLTKLYSCELSDSCKDENHGFSHGSVWQLT